MADEETKREQADDAKPDCHHAAVRVRNLRVKSVERPQLRRLSLADLTRVAALVAQALD